MVLAALGEHDAAVWLFGSCARGEALQHSDIDIAILSRDELPSGFFSDLAESVEESSIPYDVDIVDLRSAAPTLIDEVRREGGEMERLSRRLAEAAAALATLDELAGKSERTLVERSAVLRLIYSYEAVWKACQKMLATRRMSALDRRTPPSGPPALSAGCRTRMRRPR